MSTKPERFRTLAENLYAPFTAEDGVCLEEIEEAEKAYGFRLPKVLREFYLLAGNHEKITASFNRFFPVNRLETVGDKLLFCEDNQSAFYWAVNLSDIEKDDPPVWQGQSIVGQNEPEWYIDFENLSDFLLIMLCWQSVMGGLAVTGIASKIDESVVQRIKNNFSQLEVGKNGSGLQAFFDRGKVICLSENEQGANLDTGAADEKMFFEVQELLQIEWDYRSLDD